MYSLRLFLVLLLSASGLWSQSWQKCTLPAGFNVGGQSSTYLDVFFLPSNPQYGWVCGFGGRVLRTTDGGNSWQGTYVPYNGRVGGHLESIHFPSQQIGYCSGPCGAYKSTDGGATWTDLTQNLPTYTNLWGLYFLNDNYGCLLSGGCTSFQSFYLTTNGGTSWSTFTMNVPSSGMTDVLLYPDGNGYAVGSGNLYHSLDSGRTWATWQTPFPNIWDEEITKSGNSFVVPFAGLDCGGGGGANGGARFSSDNGQSWNSMTVNNPFYGAFLLNPSTAWACGSAANMWRTTNSGVNWELKNCGIDGDVDDIWFINDTTGFVVGNEVYRYSPAQRTLSTSSLDFGTMCFPGVKYDTLWLRNRSFNGASATWSISGSDVQHFSVLQPVSTSFGVPPCDSTMFVFRFQPRTPGSKNISFTVTFSDGSTLTAAITGSSGGTSTVPVDTLIVANAVQCGAQIRMMVNFVNPSTQTDQVILVNKLSGTAFNTEVNPPIIIPPGGGSVGFTVVLADTGWQVSRYMLRVGPCVHDTIVTLRAYGVSAIVNTPVQRSYTTQCLGSILDSIPVSNTGNADLIISNNYIASGSSDFSIIGWSTGEVIPVTIKKNQTKYLIVRYSPKGSTLSTAVLRFTTNDYTTTRGNKTIVDVNLQGQSSGVSELLSAQRVDFGPLCPGVYPIKSVTIANTGSADFIVRTLSIPGVAFKFTSDKVIPATLHPRDSIVFVVQFMSDVEGVYLDSLVLAFQPCDSARLVIPISAQRVSTKLSINPPSIDTLIRVSTPSLLSFEISSTGTSDAVIDAIVLTPTRADWSIVSPPTLPLHLVPGQKLIINVQLAPQGETEYQGSLTVNASSICSTAVSASIHAIASETLTSLSKSRILFAPQRCLMQAVSDTVVISNTGASADTLLQADIQPSNSSVFQLISPPTLPAVLEKNKPIVLVVRALQKAEGVDSASLVVRFANSFQANAVFIPLRMEFHAANSKALDSLIGFGTHEPCDGLQTFVVHVQNQGSLDDSLQLRLVNNDPSLSLGLKMFAVPAHSTATALVSFDPSVLPARSISDSLVFQSSVCGKSFALPISAQLLDPHLLIRPTSLSFGQVWKGDKQAEWISIVNHSTAPRTVKSITLTPLAHNQLSIPGTQTPFVVKVGDSVAVELLFSADSSGDWSGNIKVIDQSSCSDTTSVSWTASVPREVYRAHISVERNVITHVSDFADVHVLLQTNDTARDALFRAQPTALQLSLAYDDRLMNIVEIRAQRGNSIRLLPFSNESGVVNVSIPAESVRLLGATDTLISLHVQGMKSLPAQTQIHVLNPLAVVSADKQTEITTDDGDFSVQGCMMWITIGLNEVLSAQLTTQPSDDHIGVQILSSAGSVFRVQLQSTIGQSVHDETITLGAHQGELRLNASELASGAYVLRLSNEEHQEMQFMIVVQH